MSKQLTSRLLSKPRIAEPRTTEHSPKKPKTTRLPLMSSRNSLMKAKPSQPVLSSSSSPPPPEEELEQHPQKTQEEEEAEEIASQHSTSSTWWSWQSVHHQQRTPSTEQNSNSEQRNSQYLTQLGTWAYSWIPSSATSTEPPPPSSSSKLVEAIPNPISQSIPISSKGWSTYFSSRRPLPIHKLKTDDTQSVESMSISPPLSSSPPSTSKLTTVDSEVKHKTKRIIIPNLVLPTFEDTFHQPPRSFLPKPSKLQQTFELVQALIFSTPPPTEFPQTIPADSTPRSKGKDNRKRRQAIDILHHNNHVSTRLPKALNLLGIDRQSTLKKLRKIVIIGIHGWFPGPWLESVLGKPTGTSAKFVKMMEESIRTYLDQDLQGGLNQDLITSICLEGEGKVDDRVALFYNSITNNHEYIQAIKNADVVFVVSHSQGCLVSCKLIDKLLSDLALDGDRFLALAMCGIWNGPYIGLNNNFALQPVLKFFEGPAAHELFEFQDPKSSASKAVLKSLKYNLRSGVKYMMIGSMNDQVVPLYSSLAHHVDHPSILRTIFIDSAVFVSTDFLTNLIVFCISLRNAGFDDHGLIFLLSDYLVGSLSGVGHSTLYENPNLFTLAVRYFFETSSPLDPPTNLHITTQTGSPSSSKPTTNQVNTNDAAESTEEDSRRTKDGRLILSDQLCKIDTSLNPKDKLNPFLLTWSLRGLIEDHKIKLMFNDQLKFLKTSFLDWNPSTVSIVSSGAPSDSSSPIEAGSAKTIQPSNSSNSKILKDLKIKLEPFKEVQLD
ncbi:hypothetical protein Pst134EA_015933 [Puccinia striiformis f. sp. tritici]|uniref:hypothetical protein n=1 Tax=Puccinia striiformis f. sp. tritici TaxID=168172 RepID=UPI002007A6EE|nr:hypothetical protein Pst134EA_015933 [Puccinia striiformis f. sp. tritici]KAH9463852.1 hypothetical protein Pst134EA_015933 [Puccinia striiformis f. sp. tritici]